MLIAAPSTFYMLTDLILIPPFCYKEMGTQRLSNLKDHKVAELATWQSDNMTRAVSLHMGTIACSLMISDDLRIFDGQMNISCLIYLEWDICPFLNGSSSL
jgi:hypothetical protein